MIAFVGSVFSPWYAAARRRGSADPQDHVSINVALYGRGGRWAMTERSRRALSRDADGFCLGPSSLAWRDGKLEIAIEEWGVPLPRRLSGLIRLTPGPLFAESHPLDAAGLHVWQPIAPFARVEVAFSRPDLAWQGEAYLDSNAGAEPLERAFRFWTWSRARQQNRTAVFYDVERRDGTRHGLSLDLHADGTSARREAPPVRALPVTVWRVSREVRSDGPPRAVRTFEDAPFYTRTAALTSLDGEVCPTIAESVDLDRFASRWVQLLLPFRMPRRR